MSMSFSGLHLNKIVSHMDSHLKKNIHHMDLSQNSLRFIEAHMKKDFFTGDCPCEIFSGATWIKSRSYSLPVMTVCWMCLFLILITTSKKYLMCISNLKSWILVLFMLYIIENMAIKNLRKQLSNLFRQTCAQNTLFTSGILTISFKHGFDNKFWCSCTMSVCLSYFE